MKIYQRETVTGVANDRVYGNGIQSTQSDIKHILGVYINVDEYADNDVELYIERERILQMHDYFFDTYDDTGGTSTPYSTSKQCFVPLDFDLTVGKVLQAAINCGVTATDLRITYVYELK
ncbi:MAG: hypothetical protein GF393_12930 [Armatimonadia bacterium]|nr:hypothetical protein [Armatimonadia bacterium]